MSGLLPNSALNARSPATPSRTASRCLASGINACFGALLSNSAQSGIQALAQLHRRGLIHKDVKPANILLNLNLEEVRFTGFGIASGLSHKRQAVEPPETIAGTLAYMAPEQTGRMNRSIDSRSELYALGVALYQMLTGTLPFTADDPMELVHCHVARRAIPPAERVKDIPGVVSAIVIKLLAKTAEERYQTATGLKNDLQQCLAAWEAQSRIEYFRLGERGGTSRKYFSHTSVTYTCGALGGSGRICCKTDGL